MKSGKYLSNLLIVLFLILPCRCSTQARVSKDQAGITGVPPSVITTGTQPPLKDAGDDNVELPVETEDPVVFPVEEDISSAVDKLSDFDMFDIWVPIKMGGNNAFALSAFSWQKGDGTMGKSHIKYKHVLFRSNGKWEIVDIPLKYWRGIFAAYYSKSGSLYIAEGEHLLEWNAGTGIKELNYKNIKHPVAIWACNDEMLVVVSVDVIVEKIWYGWRLSDALDPENFKAGIVRVHVLSKKGNCIIPKGEYIPLYLACSGDRPVLHMLTEMEDKSYSKCGLEIRKHASVASDGTSFYDKVSYGSCNKRECGDNTLAVCCNYDTNSFYTIVDEVENFHLDTKGIEDYFVTCDGTIYNSYCEQHLNNGEWVCLPDSKGKGQLFSIDEDGVIWTLNNSDQIFRYFKGEWELVLSGKGPWK